MTIQSSKYPHPQDATNEQRKAAMKAQFISLCEEMKRREGDRVKDVVHTLLPWIVEGDWEYPIQAMTSQLEAIDCRADMMNALDNWQGAMNDTDRLVEQDARWGIAAAITLEETARAEYMKLVNEETK